MKRKVTERPAPTLLVLECGHGASWRPRRAHPTAAPTWMICTECEAMDAAMAQIEESRALRIGEASEGGPEVPPKASEGRSILRSAYKAWRLLKAREDRSGPIKADQGPRGPIKEKR